MGRCIPLVFVYFIFFFLHTLLAFSQFNKDFVADTSKAQGVRYYANLGSTISDTRITPFWIRSNQFGTVPWQSPTGIINIRATALWGDARQNRKPYLKAGIEAVSNFNKNSQFFLPEAYAAIRLGYSELYVGRRKEINGLVDTLLTSGSIAWSGNALPITQIRIGTAGFAPLKFTKGVISINAFFSHGWFADTDSMKNVRLHAKSLFLRIGKPSWKVRLYGGVNHYVQWGGYSPYLSQYMNGFLTRDGHLPSNWKAYRDVVFPVGQPGHDNQYASIDTLNQIGNHLGSIDMGMDIQIGKDNLFLYYQHIYEDNSGIIFQNFPDGLWGIRWKNGNSITNRNFQIKQVTAELLTTLDRSGTDPVYGNDDYFFNGQYLDGWVHKGFIIGTPIFTRKVDLPNKIRYASDWLNRESRPVSNNAVRSLHVGMYALAFKEIPIVLLATASRYYNPVNLKEYYNQLYTSLEINNIFFVRNAGLRAGIKVGFDTGEIFSSNLGAMVTVRKDGFIRRSKK
jgi:hypothetical protein